MGQQPHSVHSAYRYGHGWHLLNLASELAQCQFHLLTRNITPWGNAHLLALAVVSVRLAAQQTCRPILLRASVNLGAQLYAYGSVESITLTQSRNSDSFFVPLPTPITTRLLRRDPIREITTQITKDTVRERIQCAPLPDLHRLSTVLPLPSAF